MRKHLIAALTLAFSATVVSAAERSYVEAGVVQIDPSGLPRDSGHGLRGSLALGAGWHVFGEYASFDFDLPVFECATPSAECAPPRLTSFDHEVYRIGLGYNFELTDTSDLIARVAHERSSFDRFPSDRGWSAELGVRSRHGQSIETSARLRYTDLAARPGAEDRVSLLLGADWRIGRDWSLATELTLNDDANQLFVGPRWSF